MPLQFPAGNLDDICSNFKSTSLCMFMQCTCTSQEQFQLWLKKKKTELDHLHAWHRVVILYVPLLLLLSTVHAKLAVSMPGFSNKNKTKLITVMFLCVSSQLCEVKRHGVLSVRINDCYKVFLRCCSLTNGLTPTKLSRDGKFQANTFHQQFHIGWLHLKLLPLILQKIVGREAEYFLLKLVCLKLDLVSFLSELW